MHFNWIEIKWVELLLLLLLRRCITVLVAIAVYLNLIASATAAIVHEFILNIDIWNIRPSTIGIYQVKAFTHFASSFSLTLDSTQPADARKGNTEPRVHLFG